MYKIAILGCENSHAGNFLKTVVKDKKYDDVEFVGVYSDERAAAEKLNTDYGVPVMEKYDELVGKIDGLIVTARNGVKHYPFAKPYIDSGVPMFIDKPITVSEDDAKAFASELEAKNIRVSGGSSCIYDPMVEELAKGVKDGAYGKINGGFVRAPIYLDSEHSGMYFYAQHGVQIMTEIFGTDVLSVKASHVGDSVTLLCNYKDFTVTVLYSDHGSAYFASVAGEKSTPSGILNIGFECFEKEFAEYHELLHGAEQKQSYSDFFAPVYILNAMERSLASGNEEKVRA